jgi:hypothetical protein
MKMTAQAAVNALIELGVLPRGYDQPLTYTHAQGLRLSFLYRRGQASEPVRYERAATICAQLIDTIEQEFSRHPEKIHTHWRKEL